jgi:hypothetical protein
MELVVVIFKDPGLGSYVWLGQWLWMCARFLVVVLEGLFLGLNK